MLLLEMWIEAFRTCSQNIFQLFETMCYQFFRKESTLFTTKTRYYNEFSQRYWQDPSLVIPLLANQEVTPTL